MSFELFQAVFDAVGTCVAVCSEGASARMEDGDGKPLAGYRYALLRIDAEDGAPKLDSKTVRSGLEITAGDAVRWKSGTNAELSKRTLSKLRIDVSAAA